MTSNNKKPKIIVVLGQTATGKSDLEVELALKFNGEVVSADSRQVYKGLDIGTGKVPRDKLKVENEKLKGYFYKGIRHHLLDVVSPKNQFTAAEYKKKAEKAIDDIISQRKVPIVIGGTGFYIQTVVDGIIPPEVPPNKKLRKELMNKKTEELLVILKKLDPERAMSVEQKNPRRLIRAIEIARALGKVPKIKKNPKYDVLQIGLKIEDDKLKKKIKKRLIERIKGPKSSSKIGQSMIEEAKQLHEKGLSWKRMEELGLEYRYLARYLQKKLSKEEMIEQLNMAIRHYAKRQKTWFKRDLRIHWFILSKIEGFNPNETKKIEKLIRKFL